MSESTALIARLRLLAQNGCVAKGAGQDAGRVAGRQADGRSTDAWHALGLARAQLHEVYAAHVDDGACAAGFATALTLTSAALPILWLRTQAAERQGGRLHATGLVEFGLIPDTLVLGLVADEDALLRAASDGARCTGLGTVVVEAWGRAPGIDLTATRRLMLAEEASGVTVLLVRVGAQPVPSAAASRWGVTSAPSAVLEADAPGRPAFDIELQRRRGGPAGQRWRVEWNRDACRFEPLASEGSQDAAAFPGATPLSGAGLPLAAGGAAAQYPPPSVRRA